MEESADTVQGQPVQPKIGEPTKAGTYQTTNQQAVYGQTIGNYNTIIQQLPPVEKIVSPQHVWNVPYPRNPFFTGREALLSQLHTSLLTDHASALGQPQALSGLGGIGKTQLAVEYAYRYAKEYQYIFWVHAENQNTLIASYAEITTLLKLPERTEQDQALLLQAVKTWLHIHQDWLLIFDNADAPEYLLPFLPTKRMGHLLLTTRATDVSSLGLGFAHSLQLDTFAPQQGALFLLHRAGLLSLELIRKPVIQ